MAIFTLSNDSVRLIDYVNGLPYLASLPISFDASSTTIRSDLGMYNSSGVELDRTNLVIQFDGGEETVGTPSILRYRLTELPTFSSPVNSIITLYLTSGIDGERAGNETQVHLALDVIISTDAEGVTHVTAVEGDYTGRINSSSYNNGLGLTLSFSAEDEIATAYLEDGAPVLDLKFFSFLSKLDPFSEFISFSLEGNYHFHMEVEGDEPLPIQTWDAKTVSTLAAVMPIAADSNQAPQWTASSTLQLDEEQSLLVDLSAVVEDPEGKSVTYTVEGGATESVVATIEGSQLRLEGSTDFYTSSPYQLVVKAADELGAYAEHTYSVTVTDQNDAPTAVTLANVVYSLPEGSDTSTPILLADVQLVDDSVGSNVFLLSGADAAHFELNGAALYLKQDEVLDYEADNSYTVTVTASDSSVEGSEAVSVVYSLNVADLNEAPTAVTIAPTVISIQENSEINSRIKVADLAITDDALGSNSLTMSGEDVALFEIESGVLYLQAGVELDYESQSNLSVTIEAIDNSLAGSSAATADYSLLLEDQNEAPVITSSAVASILNGAEAGTVVYTATADDPDQNASLSFSLGGVDASSFQMDAVSGQVMFNEEVADFDQKSSYSIEITVDDGDLSATSQVDVAVSKELLAYYWGDEQKTITGVASGEGGGAEKVTTKADQGAINLTDVLLSLKCYLGKTQLSGYAVTAADYNGDQSVNLTDVLLTLKTYLGKESAPDWQFESVDGEIALVGLLLGDVDGSWTPPVL